MRGLAPGYVERRDGRWYIAAQADPSLTLAFRLSDEANAFEPLEDGIPRVAPGPRKLAKAAA